MDLEQSKGIYKLPGSQVVRMEMGIVALVDTALQCISGSCKLRSTKVLLTTSGQQKDPSGASQQLSHRAKTLASSFRACLCS